MTGAASEGTAAVEAIVADARCGPDDSISSRLLVAVRRGYPLESVMELLQRNDDRLARVGAWVVSELGTDGCRLRDELLTLLTHHDPHVRAFGCDSAIACCEVQSPRVLAAAIALIRDDEDFVRIGAVHLLACTPQAQLERTLPHLRALDLQAAVRWMLEVASAEPIGELRAGTEQPDLVRALVALAALARVDPTGENLELVASEATDERIESAARWLMLVRSAWR